MLEITGPNGLGQLTKAFESCSQVSANVSVMSIDVLFARRRGAILQFDFAPVEGYQAPRKKA
jgi:hypothetical protein